MLGPGVLQECIYDAASHGFVSAFIQSDVNEFCKGTSFSAWAGPSVDLAHLCDVTVLPALCPLDAGAPDGQSGN
jgi:hypothetical protein